MEKFYTIKEVADIEKISVQAVHKRINRLDDEFKTKHIKLENNKLLIDMILLNTITLKPLVDKNVDMVDEVLDTSNKNLDNISFNEVEGGLSNEYINSLKEQIKDLKNDKQKQENEIKELKNKVVEKDKIIESTIIDYSSQIKMLMETLQNEQRLKATNLFVDNFADFTDNQANEVNEEVEIKDIQDKEPIKKSFIQKLFHL